MSESGGVGEQSAYVVRGLEKRYRGRDVLASAGIDLDVPAGRVFGLLGPNGAGKSTLLRQLAGVVRPDAGALSLFGHDLVADPRLAGRLVAYLAQDEPALLELPVRLAVSTTAQLRGLRRRAAVRQAGHLLDELGITALADRPLVRLSGGQRRLACVASALAADRPVLLLDEPTAGLDPVARRAVWTAVRRRCDAGTTVVLATHNIVEAETVLDRVAVIDRGRVIACDTPGRLKAAVDDTVRVDLTWRRPPPMDDATVQAVAATSTVNGLRWSARLPRAEAGRVLALLTSGARLDALDDFTVATPSLEDVYLALGGRSDDMERS